MSEPTEQCTVIKESIFCPEAVNSKMQELISEFYLPNWVLFDLHGKERKCHSCSSELSEVCVRGVSLCLNPQHIGDIQVEFLCKKCYSNFFLHFRKVCTNIYDFLNVLDNTALISTEEPILRDKILPSDNNVADIIMADDRTKKEQSVCQ